MGEQLRIFEDGVFDLIAFWGAKGEGEKLRIVF